eukprot:TRINITY_DN3036_c0_g1_i1.p1 TRINITY_DN3036_c0_g1~~TRINITY_DN3036_c0_g1_i1.p1  ORF type:complete len:749 (+),score=124.61 TRINITY_DN3036_c0_g1_i1:217-2463(+)
MMRDMNVFHGSLPRQLRQPLAQQIRTRSRAPLREGISSSCVHHRWIHRAGEVLASTSRLPVRQWSIQGPYPRSCHRRTMGEIPSAPRILRRMTRSSHLPTITTATTAGAPLTTIHTAASRLRRVFPVATRALDTVSRAHLGPVGIPTHPPSTGATTTRWGPRTTMPARAGCARQYSSSSRYSSKPTPSGRQQGKSGNNNSPHEAEGGRSGKPVTSHTNPTSPSSPSAPAPPSSSSSSTPGRTTSNAKNHPPDHPTSFLSMALTSPAAHRVVLLTRDMRDFLFSGFLLGTGTLVLLGTTSAATCAIWVVNKLQFSERMVAAVGSYLTTGTPFECKFGSMDGTFVKDRVIRLYDVEVHRPAEENCTEMHLTIDCIEVKISMWWMLQGKGIVTEVVMSGVRGVVDKRNTRWTEEMLAEYQLPKWQWGDWVFKKFLVEDMKVTMYHKMPDRPVSLCFFKIECERLRRQWFLFDLMSAKSISGMYDNSLFSVHKPHHALVAQQKRRRRQRRRQQQRRASNRMIFDDDEENEVFGDDRESSSIVRECRIDGLSIDHIQGWGGPLEWLTRGSMNLTAVFTFPKPGPAALSPPAAGTPPPSGVVTTNWTYELVNLNAEMPLITSFRDNMVRPIVAYMNTNYTRVILEFDTEMSILAFDGAWYPGDADLWDIFSVSCSYEMTAMVAEQQRARNVYQLVLKGADGIRRGLVHWWRFLSDYVWVLYVSPAFGDDDDDDGVVRYAKDGAGVVMKGSYSMA